MTIKAARTAASSEFLSPLPKHPPIYTMSDVEKTARDEKAPVAEVGPVAGTKDGLHDDATRANPILDQILAMDPAEYKAFERKLLRKIDLRLIPWMT